jgi:immunoglobulin superfamily member 9B
MVENKRLSINSQYSSSDDGGFLPKRPRIPVPNWRRPFVYCPSEISFPSDGQNRWMSLGRNLLQTIPQLHQPPASSGVPITQNLHINTISANIPGSMIPSSNLYTPSSRLSRIHASSPATSSPMINSPWSPLYFSDLSSVHPSSAERSFPSSQHQPGRYPFAARSSNRFQRYVNELPALRTLNEEQFKMSQGFVPVQDSSPPMKSYYANIGPHVTRASRPTYRTFPRHSRMLRAVPELSSPLLNLNLNILEQSPESQSSSGFGSKNNSSSQQNQSSQSGGTIDWRLPPYRPPPQPSSSSQVYPFDVHHQIGGIVSPSSPYSMSHWFEIMQRLNLASANEFKAVDVGSVDGHYEFDHYDPSSPTPTITTPTQQQQLREDSNELIGNMRLKRQQQIILPPPPTFHYQTRYDQETIDARVQSMKEEFYLYRKKQAIKRAGIVLESAC